MVDRAPNLMTIEDVARYLSIHPVFIQQLAKDGDIPAIKLGRQWRFRRDLLDQWIIEQSKKNVNRVAAQKEHV